MWTKLGWACQTLDGWNGHQSGYQTPYQRSRCNRGFPWYLVWTLMDKWSHLSFRPTPTRLWWSSSSHIWLIFSTPRISSGGKILSSWWTTRHTTNRDQWWTFTSTTKYQSCSRLVIATRVRQLSFSSPTSRKQISIQIDCQWESSKFVVWSSGPNSSNHWFLISLLFI